MDKEKVNPNFDISVKCKDMITTSEMIVDRYQFIIDRGYEPSIYMSLAYDVKNYLPKLLKEKQELIDYLKEKITKCDKDIKIHKKEIAGVVNISENNRHILLIKRFKVEKQIYEEILSKIEKRQSK